MTSNRDNEKTPCAGACGKLVWSGRPGSAAKPMCRDCRGALAYRICLWCGCSFKPANRAGYKTGFACCMSHASLFNWTYGSRSGNAKAAS
jgi:hypothetical protein